MTITTFDEALELAAKDVPKAKGVSVWPIEDALDEIEDCLDELHESPNRPDARERWGWLAHVGIGGALGENLNEVAFEKGLAHVCKVVLQKQHDYGHDNITWGGVEGVILRSHDKLARIKNLLSRGDEAANEPLADSWLDITGYALIGMMLARGTFGLPLASDLEEDEPDEFTLGPIKDGWGHEVAVTYYSDGEKIQIATKVRDSSIFYGPWLNKGQYTKLLNALLEAARAIGWADE